MQGLRSNASLFWAPEKARVRLPLLILSLLSGTPEMQGSLSNSAHLWPQG